MIIDDWQWSDMALRSLLGQVRAALLERGACIVIGTRATEPLDPTLNELLLQRAGGNPQSVLIAERRQLHGRIAVLIERTAVAAGALLTA